MASIFKRTVDRQDKRKPYLIAYNDEHGKRHTLTGCTDRVATEEIAHKLEADARLRKRGILDPLRERIAEQARRPIGEHVDEFVQHVKARKPGGHAPRYLLQVENRLDALRESTGLKYLRELDADRVAAFVGVYVLLFLWLCFMPARLLDEPAGRPWWQRSRFWAVVIAVFQIAVYLALG